MRACVGKTANLISARFGSDRFGSGRLGSTRLIPRLHSARWYVTRMLQTQHIKKKAKHTLVIQCSFSLLDIYRSIALSNFSPLISRAYIKFRLIESRDLSPFPHRRPSPAAPVVSHTQCSCNLPIGKSEGQLITFPSYQPSSTYTLTSPSSPPLPQ